MSSSTISLFFYDEDGNDITELVELTKGRATLFHSSATFTYKHPVLGDIDIGYHTGGYITMNDGYVCEEKETVKWTQRNQRYVLP